MGGKEHRLHLSVVKCPGTFQNALGTFRNAVAGGKTALGGNTERTLTAAAPPPPRDPYRHALTMRPPQKARPFSFLNYHYTCHLATCAQRSSWPRRTAPSVRPNGRSSKALWENRSDTGRTAHFRAVDAQRGALIPDVQPVAPTPIESPIWPVLDRARPCECHATIAHVTAAAAMGV